MFASAAENGAPFTRDIAALIDGATSRWVLDPLASRAEFHIKHFWGIITVHGRFERISGEGVGGPNGVVSGQIGRAHV